MNLCLNWCGDIIMECIVYLCIFVGDCIVMHLWFDNGQFVVFCRLSDEFAFDVCLLLGVGCKSIYWHSVSFLLLGVGCKSIYWRSVSFVLLGVGYKSIYWHFVSLESGVSPSIGILFPFVEVISETCFICSCLVLPNSKGWYLLGSSL